MKCLKCGNEVGDGERFCSSCGAKIEKPEPLKEEAGTKEYVFYGRKWVNKLVPNDIVTKILKNNDNLDVSIKFSRRKIKNYKFNVSEIQSSRIKLVPNIGITDYIRIPIMALCAFSSFFMGAPILGMGLALAMLLFVWLAFTKAIVIELNNGIKVSVPIVNDYDAKEFYTAIGMNSNGLSEKSSKNTLIFYSWLVVCIIVIALGTTAYKEARQREAAEEDDSRYTIGEVNVQPNADDSIQETAGKEDAPPEKTYSSNKVDVSQYDAVNFDDLTLHEDLWTGQNISVIGYISEVNIDEGGYKYFVLGVDGMPESVAFVYYDDALLNTGIEEGNTVTVYGKYYGIETQFGYPEIEAAKIEYLEAE